MSGGTALISAALAKAYSLDAAIDDLAPALGSDGAVPPVLNGINHIAV
jgi:ketopantoate reductase